MDFQDKKITVMGLGLLGRGVGVVKYLVEKGAKVTVTDLKSEKELIPSIREIKVFHKNLKSKILNLKSKSKMYPPKFVLGGHDENDFISADMVFKAAGVSLDSPYVAEAKRHGVPVFMDDALFAREAPCKIIGITGTRGKTTTSTLIYEIAKATGKKVYLAGNIRGTATLPFLDQVKKDDLVVLELSSWQLQGWRDFKISPRIAVVTNIYKDHMNYYKNDMKKYIYDKTAIFEHQIKNDYLVLNQDCPYCQKFGRAAESKVVWFRADDVATGWHLKILGEHNLENIAAAMAVGRLLGLSRAKIKQVIENFPGIPGRLEFVREAGGVKYYNDTTATMPEATIAALAALGQGLRLRSGNKLSPERAKRVEGSSKRKNIVLIAGGADKNLEFEDLAKAIKKHTKALILLQGAATPKIQQELLVTRYSLPVTVANSMHNAVRAASKLATRGDAILLSPAAASFGMFKNEFDRGEQFLKEVKKLK